MDRIDMLYMEEIDPFTETNIKDKNLIMFLNNLKSKKLRRILRKYIEKKCYFELYSLDDLEREFKNHYENDNGKYFLPDMNDRLEDILKMLLLKGDQYGSTNKNI